MSVRFCALGLLCLFVPGAVAAGSSVRYALIVGNNHGNTTASLDLPDLDHAEQEARTLHDTFIRLGNFDDDQQRTILLTGAGRQKILDAAQQLAQRHRADRAALGQVPTLFAFYYTGHGLDGTLLTADDPLSGEDLAQIFTSINATFTVGIFDACYSGSLDLDTLKAKGLRPTPGFNAFNELPREVLNSSGTMWFVSSQPDQVSYEDIKLGGVFTHYFVEGMQRARGDSFGVTLEQIWEYARSRTQQYTARSGREQTPQKMVRNLTSSGPLYFSFPGKRNAELVFEPGVRGRFLVRYAAGQLTELVDKSAASELRVPVYASPVVLERLDVEPAQRQHIDLHSGDTVWVRDRSGWAGPGLVSNEQVLQVKGGELKDLVLTRQQSSSMWLHLDLGYQYMLAAEYSPVVSHNLALGLQLDYALFSARLGLDLGYPRTESYPAWGYTLMRGGVNLELGPSVALGPVRLGAVARTQLFAQDVRYRNSDSALQPGLGIGAAGTLRWTLCSDPVGVQIVAALGASAEYASPVAPPGAEPSWTMQPNARAGLALGTGL